MCDRKSPQYPRPQALRGTGHRQRPHPCGPRRVGEPSSPGRRCPSSPASGGGQSTDTRWSRAPGPTERGARSCSWFCPPAGPTAVCSWFLYQMTILEILFNKNVGNGNRSLCSEAARVCAWTCSRSGRDSGLSEPPRVEERARRQAANVLPVTAGPVGPASLPTAAAARTAEPGPKHLTAGPRGHVCASGQALRNAGSC